MHEEHGIQRPDPYHWLKNRDDPDTLPHLEAENDYLDAVLGRQGFRKALYDEMLGRIQETDQSVPYDKRGFRYYVRTVEGKAYPIYCRRPLQGGNEGDEQIVLDHNELADGQAYYSIGGMAVSPDARLVAWLEDTSGAEQFVLRARSIEDGVDVAVKADGLKWGIAWAADSRTLFVTGSDHASRPGEVRRVQLESDAEPEVVYSDDDETFFVGVTRTHDERYVVFGSESKTSSEWYLLDASDPTSEPICVAPRRPGIEYDIAHHEGRLLIRTNEGARNFQLLARPVEGGETEVVIPHDDQVLLEGVLPFRGHWVVLDRKDGLPRIQIRDLSSGEHHFVEVPEPAYDISLERNPEYSTNILRFAYTSLITPRSVFSYDMDTRQRTLLKQDPVLGGYNRSLYESRRLTVEARDGIHVPISLVYRRDTARPAPLLLYGYGSYGMSMPVYFSSTRLSLLDRGVIFAIAHVRGGSELGRAWYEQGKLTHKTNTFHDFVDCAGHLISEGFTTADKLAIQGGSAGGLLVGAVLNDSPELFCAAVAQVPFVDALNTMLDDKLPLTVTEYEEWGNPNEKSSYDVIASYAPYDNITDQRYPAILATAGLNDPRVGYWEAAKWVCRLRDHQQGDAPILLHTNLDAGHAGASGRYEALEELALVYTFLLDQWGLSSNEKER